MLSDKAPFHVRVAEKLIAQLKEGTAPWQKPWDPGQPGVFLPVNPLTGKRYKGINTIQLLSAGYTDPRWMTYKQAQSQDYQVRRGEQGTPIQFWSFTEYQDQTNDQGQPVVDAQGKPVKVEIRLERPRVRFATVFNAEQIGGIAPWERKPVKWNPIDRAEQMVRASGALIRHDQRDSAFYRPATDTIHLPDKAQFARADAYYATALHELGHWTGHSTRLDRDLAHPFGSEGYAKEELRAEIASMILGDELGIGHDPGQHAAYVENWIKVLRDDPLEVFRAAADAEKIHAWVCQLERQLTRHVDGADAQEPTIGKLSPDAEQQSIQRLPLLEVTMQEKHFIDVPFREKDEAKKLGARWDRQQQAWYIPVDRNHALFEKWNRKAEGRDQDSFAAAPQAAGSTKHYLAVPYSEHALAKAAGARWDKAAKSWYIGPQADRSKLTRWLPENATNQTQDPALSLREEFAEVLRHVGAVAAGEHPIMDGQKHRIAVEGDKNGEQAGFYVAHVDGHPAGYVKNNRTGIEIKWKSKGYTITPEEKALLHAAATQKRQARAAEQARQHEQSAQRIMARLANLIPLTAPTPYLDTKRIPIQPSVFTDEAGQATYIPAYDADGKVWTMQTIHEDGTKRFAKNSRKEGCFHVPGGLAALAQSPAIVIAEGYATAGTLTHVLGFPAVTAFDSGNLPHVAKALATKFLGKLIFIAGDDDRHLEQTQGVNPGRAKAEEAAAAVNGKVIFPIFAPSEQATDPKGFTDFNDLATRSVLGVEGVERQVKTCVCAAIEKRNDRDQQEKQHVKANSENRFSQPRARKVKL